MSRKVFEWGGILASMALIAFGLGSIGFGIAGVNEVRDKLAQENIVGTEDSSIPGQKVDTGSEAKAFADVMRMHALESTDGLTYAEMGRFVSAENPQDPAGTSDEAEAAKDENGEPVSNGARNIWVTETSLATCAQRRVLRRAGGVLHHRDGDHAATDRHRIPGAVAQWRAPAERSRTGCRAGACSGQLSGRLRSRREGGSGPPSFVLRVGR